MIVTGKTVKQLREERGLSQSGLARLAGVSQAHVAKIESEKVDPRLSTMNRILFVLTRERRTRRCREVMNRNVVSVRPDTPVENDRLFRRDLFLLQLQAARRRRPTPLRIVAQRSVRVISSTR